MAEPIVTFIGVDRTRISSITGQNTTNIFFTFDIDVVEYSIDVTGTSHSSGILAGHRALDVTTLKTQTVAQIKAKTVSEIKKITANTLIQDQVDNSEMYAEGNNRVNIYGKSIDGTWSSYNQP